VIGGEALSRTAESESARGEPSLPARTQPARTDSPSAQALLDRYGDLRELQSTHLDEAAEAFVALQPDYFLSRFGRTYLARAFWPTFADAADCFGFVWMHDGRVVGFAAGTVARDRFLRRVISRAPMPFLARLAIVGIRDPRFVSQGVDLMRRLREERSRGGPHAELISLGVLPRALKPVAAPDGRSSSPALVLMAASVAKMTELGATSFRLYTGANNHLACSFYRRLGLAELRRFRMFGEEKICFVGSVGALSCNA